MEVADDGGRPTVKKTVEDGDATGDEDDDGDAAAGPVAAEEVSRSDAVDDGHQDDGEEGADVEDLELFGELPGEDQRYEHTEEKEDVAVDASALLLCLGAGSGIRSGLWVVSLLS